jgi:hypothetical protein
MDGGGGAASGRPRRHSEWTAEAALCVDGGSVSTPARRPNGVSAAAFSRSVLSNPTLRWCCPIVPV